MKANYAGQKIGTLTALSYVRSANCQQYYLSRCDLCGVTQEASWSEVRAGRKTCSCRSVRERHGKSATRTYRIWQGMHTRCNNPKHHTFIRYGGRGITVCPRWGKFSAFLEDMGECPAGRSLDRIDNEGPYSPGNCQWATRKQQARNTRTNTFVLFDGKRMTVADVAERMGITYNAARWIVRSQLERVS